MPEALDTARIATWSGESLSEIRPGNLNVLTMNVVMPPRKSRRIASHLFERRPRHRGYTNRIATDGPLISNRQIRRSVFQVDVVFIVANKAVDFAVATNSGQSGQRLGEMSV